MDCKRLDEQALGLQVQQSAPEHQDIHRSDAVRVMLLMWYINHSHALCFDACVETVSVLKHFEIIWTVWSWVDH